MKLHIPCYPTRKIESVEFKIPPRYTISSEDQRDFYGTNCMKILGVHYTQFLPNIELIVIKKTYYHLEAYYSFELFLQDSIQAPFSVGQVHLRKYHQALVNKVY